MLGDQIARYQKLQCIVNSSSTHTVLFVFHMDIQGLHVEMICT
jgi:hypothetical protein